MAFATLASVHLRIQLPTEEVRVKGRFEIDSVLYSTSYFGSRWIYMGYLEDCAPYRHIPISVSLVDKESMHRPSADLDYLIEGTLRYKERGGYILKPDKDLPWIPIENSFSLAEWRLHAKDGLKKIIKNQLHHTDSAAFLSGIATGEFNDNQIKLDFGRFGVQHIMAVSGFHFNLLAAFFLSILSLAFPRRLSLLAILLLLFAYFLFLGPSPSVLRAFLTIGIMLLGLTLHRTTTGLNALSCTCFILLLYEPHLLSSIGFIFSTVTTASILLFYEKFERLFEKRTLEEAIHLSTSSQVGVWILSLIRKSLALTLAVNVTALPLTLYFFGKFPLMGLLYNLFFPFLVSLSMILLLIGQILPFGWIHSFTDHFTHQMLAFTSNPPLTFDYMIRGEPSPYLILGWLIALFLIDDIKLFWRRASYILSWPLKALKARQIKSQPQL